MDSRIILSAIDKRECGRIIFVELPTRHFETVGCSVISYLHRSLGNFNVGEAKISERRECLLGWFVRVQAISLLRRRKYKKCFAYTLNRGRIEGY